MRYIKPGFVYLCLIYLMFVGVTWNGVTIDYLAVVREEIRGGLTYQKIEADGGYHLVAHFQDPYVVKEWGQYLWIIKRGNISFRIDGADTSFVDIGHLRKLGENLIKGEGKHIKATYLGEE